MHVSSEVLAPRALGRAVAGTLLVLWQLIRPMTMILILFQGAFAWAVLDARAPAAGPTVIAVFALLCWYAHAVAVNDLSDVATDRINLSHSPARARRPLLNQSAGHLDLVIISTVLAIAMVTLSAAISLPLAGVALAVLGLDYAYSMPPVRLSGRGGLAQLVLPLGYVVVPATYAWTIAGQPPVTAATVAALAGLYVLFAGRLLLKDLRDVIGDAATGKRTFVLRHGETPTLTAAGSIMIIGIGVMVLALPWRPALDAAALLAAPALLLGLRSLHRESALERKLLWTGMIGRVGSGWLFCCLVSLAAHATMINWQAELLTVLAATMFAFGCCRFVEELRRPTR